MFIDRVFLAFLGFEPTTFAYAFIWTKAINFRGILVVLVATKEGCNWGHGLSAAIKLGSLEKTVIVSLFHSVLHSGAIFLWKKTMSYVILGNDKKRPKFFMMPNWFFDHLQLFLVTLFFVRCQTKALLWRIHVSLGPKWKNQGSGLPSLMAADKPCHQLQPSLVATPSKYDDGRMLASFGQQLSTHYLGVPGLISFMAYLYSGVPRVSKNQKKIFYK